MYACTGRYRISMGVTGMAIVRAIVGGEQDARQLAKLRDRRCHQVAPNSSTSRPGPPSLGAHTQCFLLPRSIPATLGRTTGNPSASSSLSRLLYYWFSHDSSTSCYPPSEHDSQVGRHSDSVLAFSRSIPQRWAFSHSHVQSGAAGLNVAVTKRPALRYAARES